MGVAFKVKQHTLLAKIDGEIDHHSCEIIREKIDNAIIEKNANNVIIDLDDVTFMDSSGIGLIMGRYKIVQKLGGQAAVVCKNHNYLRVLKMSSVDKFVLIYTYEETALKNLFKGDKKA